MVSRTLEVLSNTINSFHFLKNYEDRLKELKNRLEKDSLVVVFTGEFSSGKTSLLNALYNLNLPTDVLPKTASIWELKRGDDLSIVIHLKNGDTKVASSIEEAEKIPPKDIKFIELNSPLIPENIVLVDTPGLSSLNEHHKEVLENYIDNADILFVIIDVNQGLTKATKDFIEEQKEKGVSIFLIINKIDIKPPSVTDKLKEYLAKQFPSLSEKILTASAKKQILDEIKETIERIREEKDKFIEKKVSFLLRNLCSELKATIKFQLENLNLDLSDLSQKEFEIERSLRDLELEFDKLKVDLKKKLNKALDKAAEIFKGYLINNTESIIQAIYDENTAEGLQDRFSKKIKEAHQKALSYLEKELKIVSEYLETSISEINRNLNLEQDIGIIITDTIVKFRELILDVISLILFRIPAGRFVSVLRKFVPGLRGLLGLGIQTFSKSYVRKKVIETLDNVSIEYKKILEQGLEEEFDTLFFEFSKALREKEKSLKQALENLKLEKQKRKEEFENYKNRLEENLRKLEQICPN